ncbi:MAG: hypothetical protein AAFY06_13735, partial [Pseudomonadota bacterium]
PEPEPEPEPEPFGDPEPREAAAAPSFSAGEDDSKNMFQKLLDALLSVFGLGDDDDDAVVLSEPAIDSATLALAPQDIPIVQIPETANEVPDEDEPGDPFLL